MVVPRKWKLVAGTMSATVALGTSAAIAQDADEIAGPDSQPTLTEVVDIKTLPQLEDADESGATTLDIQASIDETSPFDSIAEDSVPSTDSEPSVSEPSAESTESASIPSPDSTSVSAPSVESVSADSSD
jgi:hypothetical protein